MTVDKRTVALGLAAVGAVTAAVVVTVANHKGGPSAPRKRVGAYIDDVNTVQNAMRAPLARVLLAYRDFARQSAVAHDPKPELAAATTTLERLERRLAAIPAPVEARRLRALLLQLVSKEAMLTNEVRQMAVFAPPFGKLVRQAHTANVRLDAALRAVKIPQAHPVKGTKAQILAAQKTYQGQAAVAAAAQADAIAVYDGTLLGIVRQLGKLRPPPAFGPGYRAQLHAFESLRAAGARLSAELRSSNRSNVATLGREFTIASRSAQSTAAQKAQIAAIKQYNARAEDVRAAAARVQVELQRLQSQLP